MFARPPLLGVVAALVLFSAGITGSVVGQAANNVTVRVERADLKTPMLDKPVSFDEWLVDEPLKIVITGLGDTDQFKLEIRSEDAAGTLWRSVASWDGSDWPAAN